jgi:hypothetical protein
MALYAPAQGGLVNALDLDQFFNLLTGVMSDQPVTIANDVDAKTFEATGASGLGSPASARLVGGWTTVGPPSGLTPETNDFGLDSNQQAWAYNGSLWRGTSAMTLLATINPTGSTATLMNSIPQMYTHLLIKGSARNTSSGRWFQMFLDNDSSGGNWDYGWSTYVIGTTAGFTAGGNVVSQNFGVLGTMANAVATNVSTYEIFIPNYTSTSIDKSVMCTSSSVIAYGATSDLLYQIGFAVWHPATPAAITRIDLQPLSGNFNLASFSLYGIQG